MSDFYFFPGQFLISDKQFLQNYRHTTSTFTIPIWIGSSRTRDCDLIDRSSNKQTARTQRPGYSKGTMAFTTVQNQSQQLSTLEWWWKHRQNPLDPISLHAKYLRCGFKIESLPPLDVGEKSVMYHLHPQRSTSMSFHRISRQISTLKQWRFHHSIWNTLISLHAKN